MDIKKFLTGATISLIGFLFTMVLLAQLWVAIYFPCHIKYNVVRIWTK